MCDIFLKFHFMCVGVLSVCMFMHHTCAWCQWRPSDPLELELPIVVNHHVVLRNKPRTSGKATSALNIWDSSPAHMYLHHGMFRHTMWCMFAILTFLMPNNILFHSSPQRGTLFTFGAAQCCVIESGCHFFLCILWKNGQAVSSSVLLLYFPLWVELI